MLNLTKKIFKIKNEKEFNDYALEVFRFQSKNCKVYGEYIKLLGINTKEIKYIEQIPFLPISFFKTHCINCMDIYEEVFYSSTTTSDLASKHYIADINIYRQNFGRIFEEFYGAVENYNILALLPSYLQRKGSSLVYMADKLIQKAKPHSGFYLDDFEHLKDSIIALEEKREQTILLGVSFALLDFVEQYPMELKNTIVMETGGMKGKRKEMIREELHQILKKGFGVDTIHSEYGMTELLSQAYSKGGGIFCCSNWMRVLIRDPYDPFKINSEKRGGINIIDLANIYSCSFIATDDIGKMISSSAFKVLGRMDNLTMRGCNLMVI